MNWVRQLVHLHTTTHHLTPRRGRRPRGVERRMSSRGVSRPHPTSIRHPSTAAHPRPVIATALVHTRPPTPGPLLPLPRQSTEAHAQSPCTVQHMPAGRRMCRTGAGWGLTAVSRYLVSRAAATVGAGMSLPLRWLAPKYPVVTVRSTPLPCRMTNRWCSSVGATPLSRRTALAGTKEIISARRAITDAEAAHENPSATTSHCRCLRSSASCSEPRLCRCLWPSDGGDRMAKSLASLQRKSSTCERINDGKTDR